MYVAISVPAVTAHAAASGKSVQDSAGLRALSPITQAAQPLQFLFEPAKLCHPARYVPDMLIEQLINVAAVLLGRIAKLEQRADLLERHVERAAMTDERQALDMVLIVRAVIARPAGGMRQESSLLVVADGFGLAASSFREIADAHGFLLDLIVTTGF